MMKGILFAGFAIAFGFSVAGAGAETLPLVTGTIKMVDAKASRLTIEHEPISNLDVGQMTMVFNAANADVLKKARVGGKVKFSAIRLNGQVTVTSLLAEDAMLNGNDCE